MPVCPSVHLTGPKSGHLLGLKLPNRWKFVGWLKLGLVGYFVVLVENLLT